MTPVITSADTAHLHFTDLVSGCELFQQLPFRTALPDGFNILLRELAQGVLLPRQARRAPSFSFLAHVLCMISFAQMSDIHAGRVVARVQDQISGPLSVVQVPSNMGGLDEPAFEEDMTVERWWAQVASPEVATFRVSGATDVELESLFQGAVAGRLRTESAHESNSTLDKFNGAA